MSGLSGKVSAIGFCVALLVTSTACTRGQADGEAFPDPAVEITAKAQPATIVLAGGCFWGVEAVYEHVKGVQDVVSGFASGVEAVRITYDPAKVSYAQLLKIFFSVVHDPTQLNRQGPDVGPQYRSAIFIANPEEQRAAQAYIAKLTDAKIFPNKIVTEVAPLVQFDLAGNEHQDYAARNPNSRYIVVNDLPKIAKLKTHFPALYRATTLSES